MFTIILFVLALGPMAGTLADDAVPDVTDLPVIEVLASGTAQTDTMGIFLTGDGGWWSLDRIVSETFAAHGVPIAGISSYKYFGKPQTPDKTAQDMVRILRHYMAQWKKTRAILIGYSLGAELIPFVASRLPDDLRAATSMIVLIGPSAETEFEVHLADLLHIPTKVTHYSVKDEIAKLKDYNVLCVSSDKDKDCICAQLDMPWVASLVRAGDHHFDNQFKPLGEAIWDACGNAKPREPGK